MHVLVIGGCGFIGSHIVDHLLAASHRVTVIDRSSERFRPPLQSVTYHHGELLEIEAFVDVVASADAILHTASSTTPASSDQDPEYDVKNNLVAMLRLLACMLRHGKRRILFLSSGGTVYGSTDALPISESHPLRPTCSYGIVKVAIEHYLNAYAAMHGLRPIIIRAANPYGTRQWCKGAQGAIANFTTRAIRNEPLTLWGDGGQIRDFFHVSDLARLCRIAIESDVTGTFNAGSGHGHSIREIIGLLEEIHARPLRIEQKPERAFDANKVVLDIAQAQHHFLWQPEIELKTGMRGYYDWLKSALAATTDHGT